MQSAISRTRWKKSDAAWFLLAVTVHAFVLLIPLEHPASPTVAVTTLNISLVPFLPNAADSTPDATFSSSQNTRKVMAIPETKKPSPVQRNEPAEKSTLAVLTTAHLLETVRTSLLDHSQASAFRRLGIHVPQELPANWRPGTGARALQPADNLFDGMVSPSEIEIVDRWLAADGSHNVVMNLPNGETMCGRAEPWSPLQPLVEHVMIFRSCGSGGKRTFSMVERIAKSRTASSWENSID